MTASLRRARARLLAGAGAAGLVLLLVVSAAPPAGAQTTEGSDRIDVSVDTAATPSSRFQAGIQALVRMLVDRPVEDPAAEAPAPAPADCADAGRADAPVAEIVVEVFRCRVLEAGGSPEEARRVAAEAVTVAACESRLDATAVVFDGRYADVPHPNGNRYTAAGVFQFIQRVADRWVDGGYAAVLDARANVDAAARLYLHTRAAGFRGWEDWACAAVSDGFADASVLPGWPGGPAELPDWAWELVDAR
jgi:hypothetical protein